jgi:hypothetical protein
MQAFFFNYDPQRGDKSNASLFPFKEHRRFRIGEGTS